MAPFFLSFFLLFLPFKASSFSLKWSSEEKVLINSSSKVSGATASHRITSHLVRCHVWAWEHCVMWKEEKEEKFALATECIICFGGGEVLNCVCVYKRRRILHHTLLFGDFSETINDDFLGYRWWSSKKESYAAMNYAYTCVLQRVLKCVQCVCCW